MNARECYLPISAGQAAPAAVAALELAAGRLLAAYRMDAPALWIQGEARAAVSRFLAEIVRQTDLTGRP